MSLDLPSFSSLAWGAWRLLDGKSQPSSRTIIELLEHLIDLDITTVDLADIYGNYQTEPAFGQALALRPDLRERLQLITKCGIKLESRYRIKHYDSSPEHVQEAVDQSLKNLATDTIDVLLLHRPDPLMDPDALAACLDALVASGKVRRVGVSNFQPAEVDLLASRLAQPMVAHQMQLSVLHHQPLLDGTVSQCMRSRMVTMAWSPLHGGRLFHADDPACQRVRRTLVTMGDKHGGATLSQVALAWLLRHPAGIVPIVGTIQKDRLSEMAGALDVLLSREDWFEILEAVRGHAVP